MTRNEVLDTARLIDEGILRAQQRLLERARHDGSSLIFSREGKVIEILADNV